MTQAKAPDNEGDWDSLDIFLFSNGQEYSPPRKYHLRADELNWWDATLNHLAKSQFGCMHTALQLYTLDGRKVEGPLELSNGGAYVAVEPPDTFIDSGYDKYLIKATRSWEKRQAKKSNSNEVTQDVAQAAPKEDLKRDINVSDPLLSIKTPEENFTMESVINAPMKVPNVAEIQQQTIKLPHAAKQVEKKKTSVTQRVTTFRKVINPPTTPPAKKLALKTSPQRKFTKPIRPVNTPQANLIAKSKLYAKSVYNKTRGNVPVERSKGVEPKSVSSLTRVSSNYKIMSTDSTPMDNVIGDKEIILVSNMYRNPENDTRSTKINNSTAKKEQAGVQYSPEIIRIDEEIQSVVNHTAETPQGRISIQREDVRNKIRIVNVTPDSNTINPVDDNYVTFMNRGDVVNLRLMIEVRNVDNRNVKYRTVQRSQSVTNVSRPQKESQDNMEDEVLIQSKSLQSMLENEYSQSMHTEGDTKVVVVRCGCRQYDNENDMPRANESSMCTCNKRFFILLPKWEDNDRSKRDDDTKQNTDNYIPKKEEFRNSTIIPIKQTFSADKNPESNNTKRKSRDIDAMTEPINTERKKSRDMEAITEPTSSERKYSRDTEAITEPINTERKKSRDKSAITEPMISEPRISRDIDAIAEAIINEHRRSRDTEGVSESINKERKKSCDIDAIAEAIINEHRRSRDIEAVSEPINKERKKSRDIESTSEPFNTERKKSRDIEAITELINTEIKRRRDLEAPNNSCCAPQSEYTNPVSSSSPEYCSNEYTTDEYVVTKQIITEDKDPQSYGATGQRSSIVSERTEYIVRRKSSLKEPKIYVDNFTQTDNSDILLEARRHEDGRYTFHLPSLYTLKTYFF